MTQRSFSFAQQEHYHVYNRGTDKRDIFKDNLDYQRFIELLLLPFSFRINIRDVRKFNESIYHFDRGDPLVYIGAYCLMPNHFHILLIPAIEKGIQIFMQKLSTGYSMYFNKRYERTGALFESRFKAHHVNSDEHLKYLFSYIHLNPVKLIQSDWKECSIRDIEKVKSYLGAYEFSSLKDYVGNRAESAILDSKKFPQYFIEKTQIDSELLSWLEYKEYIEQ